MADFPLRKLALQIEEIHHDFGPAPATPRLRGAVLAVVQNPFAGGLFSQFRLPESLY